MHDWTVPRTSKHCLGSTGEDDGIDKAQARMELVETRFASLDELGNEALSIEDLKARLHALKLWSPQRGGPKKRCTPVSLLRISQQEW